MLVPHFVQGASVAAESILYCLTRDRALAGDLDRRLAGVLAHELAHDDLGHVAKAQALGAGLHAGMILLDRLFPGSGALTPIAGRSFFFSIS